MTNNDMLQNIEYLREKANVSYEDAMELLQTNDNDVMIVIVKLEKRGLLYSQPADHGAETYGQQFHDEVKEVKGKAKSFFNKAKRTRLVIESTNKAGEKETVANISALAAGCLLIFAPHFTVAMILLTLITGHQVKVEKNY